MRVRTVYSKRGGHELSGASEALVGVVLANQRSLRHFYVFLRCGDVRPNEILNDARPYEGKDSRPPGLCVLHPRGHFRTLWALRSDQKVSPPGL